MKNFNVEINFLTTKNIEVEAEDKEEAMDIVEDLVFNDEEKISLNDSETTISLYAKEIESKEKTDCENCKYYCPTCGSCNYEEE